MLVLGNAPEIRWNEEAMNLTVQIPDDLARRLGAAGDLSRRALEALAAEAYRLDRLTRPELQRLLGMDTSGQLDEFMRIHSLSEERAAVPEPRSTFEQGLGLFGSPDDATLLDEVVATAYEERHRQTKAVPPL